VLLQSAIADADCEAFSEVCQYLAEKEAAAALEGSAGYGISPKDMQFLLLAALHKSSSEATALHKFSHKGLLAAAAACLLGLAAAKALGPDAVAKLTAACVERYNAAGLMLVGQLPAAAQLDQQKVAEFMQTILQEMCNCHNYSPHVSPGARDALLRALLQQPAVQRLRPDVVAQLLVLCIEEELHQPLLLLCSQLPAARQGVFDQDVVLQLLQPAFDIRHWDTFDWLMKLPAAPRSEDNEVSLWCAVRACQSAH
jgi:hypothetical protein